MVGNIRTVYTPIRILIGSYIHVQSGASYVVTGLRDREIPVCIYACIAKQKETAVRPNAEDTKGKQSENKLHPGLGETYAGYCTMVNTSEWESLLLRGSIVNRTKYC